MRSSFLACALPVLPALAIIVLISRVGSATTPRGPESVPLGLDLAPAWIGEGNQTGAAFGVSVATAGDVNGDGYSDVLVGATGYDNGQMDEGRAFLHLGSAAGLGLSPAWTAESGQDSAAFGVSVAPAGDVNGDGYSDVLVGAQWIGNGQAQEGRAYLYLGSATGLAASPAWTAESNQTAALFGFSLGTAGDVNGDGYSDVVVGAYQFDNGQADEGRAYLYLGSATGLGASPAWTAESNQVGALFGISVSTAGDVNGDGYSDVVIGADQFDNGETQEGRAFLYLGSPGGLGASPAWTAESNQGGALFGISVATAGDTNGDGYSDVIVGSYGFTNGQTAEGRAFVYVGGAGGLSPSPAWTAESNQIGAGFGWSVGPAGDVNGDGFADVIVGALRYDTRGTDGGKAFVYLGSRAGPETTFDWSAGNDQDLALFGYSAATAGDVNGDGFSDVVVGAPGVDNGQIDEGQASVYEGSGGPPGALPAWTAESNQASAFFGTWVATAGDVNGDGFSDVIIGAPGYDSPELSEGRAFVYHGSINGLGVPQWTGESNQPGADFGFSVGTAGDVNGDGYSDVIVGAYFYDVTVVDEGRVYVYHGSAAGLANAPAWTEEGNQSDAQLGSSVSTAGDVNGDGYSDVIVGANFYSNGQLQEGRAYAYMGSAAGLAANPAWIKESNQAGALFGSAVSTAGDVNGDGYSDVIIGAYSYANGEQSEGRAYVYMGSATGLAASPAWTAEGNQTFADFGWSVDTAGDVNGDGYSDVIVGAWIYDNGQQDEGRALVYLGSPAGLSPNPAWTAESDQADSGFGWGVANAGDVNGDGYSDVIISAIRFDAGQTDEGRLFVYLGSATGLGTTPAWTTESNQPDAEFGRAVASAGDVNGDGFADVIGGAWEYDGGQSNEGWVSLSLGNERLAADAHLTLDPRQRRLAGGPIDLLGLSDTQNSFRLAARGRSAAGRARVRMEWQVAAVPNPIGGPPSLGTWVDTGAPTAAFGSAVQIAELAGGLAPSTSYHWRMRIASRSPFFPHTPWLSVAPSVPSLKHFRTKEGTVSVDAPESAPTALRLEAVRPNPFTPTAAIAYTLANAGRARLAIVDVGGRRVRTLVDGWVQSGRQLTTWDGRTDSGSPAASGVYFARLEANGEVRAQKLVLSR